MHIVILLLQQHTHSQIKKNKDWFIWVKSKRTHSQNPLYNLLENLIQEDWRKNLFIYIFTPMTRSFRVFVEFFLLFISCGGEFQTKKKVTLIDSIMKSVFG